MPTIKTQVDTTVDIELEVEIYCATCGEGLCKQSTAGKTHNRNQEFIEVEVCPKCKNNAYDEGYEAAQKEFDKSQ